MQISNCWIVSVQMSDTRKMCTICKSFKFAQLIHWAKLYSFCHNRNLPLAIEETMAAIVHKI